MYIYNGVYNGECIMSAYIGGVGRWVCRTDIIIPAKIRELGIVLMATTNAIQECLGILTT